MNAVNIYIAFSALLLLALFLVIFRLVQERAKHKKIEAELVRSHERFRVAMESSNSVGWEWDLASGRDVWFGDLRTIFGIPSDTFTGQVTDFLGYVHPEDRQRISEAVAHARRSRKFYNEEYRVVWLDGTTRWIESRGKFEYATNGDAIRMLGLAIDVTARKQLEEALRKSEEKFSKTFRDSPMALTLTNAEDDRYVDVNETFELLSGWLREDVIGRTPIDIGIWVDSSKRTEFIRQLLSGSSVRNLELRYRTKNGEIRTVLASGELIEIDGTQCALSVIADITERKQAEELLHQREAELAEAQRIAAVGSWWWDHTTDTVAWSDELYRIAGLDPDLPAPTYREHPRLYTAESWERLDAAVEEAMRTGTPYELDLEMVLPDGTTKWLIARGEALRDATHRIVQLRGTVQDITKRRRVEEALSEVSGRLLEAQDEERRRIARELHDDVSQKLGMLTIGLQQLAITSSESQPLLRDRIDSLLKGTSEMSNDVHALSHRLHTSKLELLGLVGAARSFCRELAEQRHVEVDFAHSDVPSFLPSQVSICLYRILQEGLGNAVKHSGARRFEVQLKRVVDELQLTIRDSGLGFDPSLDVHNRGLGLISMRERINLLKGALSIESKPGEGTQVQARVTIAAQTGADQKSASA